MSSDVEEVEIDIPVGQDTQEARETIAALLNRTISSRLPAFMLQKGCWKEEPDISVLYKGLHQAINLDSNFVVNLGFFVAAVICPVAVPWDDEEDGEEFGEEACFLLEIARMQEISTIASTLIETAAKAHEAHPNQSQDLSSILSWRVSSSRRHFPVVDKDEIVCKIREMIAEAGERNTIEGVDLHCLAFAVYLKLAYKKSTTHGIWLEKIVLDSQLQEELTRDLALTKSLCHAPDQLFLKRLRREAGTFSDKPFHYFQGIDYLKLYGRSLWDKIRDQDLIMFVMFKVVDFTDDVEHLPEALQSNLIELDENKRVMSLFVYRLGLDKGSISRCVECTRRQTHNTESTSFRNDFLLDSLGYTQDYRLKFKQGLIKSSSPMEPILSIAAMVFMNHGNDILEKLFREGLCECCHSEHGILTRYSRSEGMWGELLRRFSFILRSMNTSAWGDIGEKGLCIARIILCLARDTTMQATWSMLEATMPYTTVEKFLGQLFGSKVAMRAINSANKTFKYSGTRFKGLESALVSFVGWELIHEYGGVEESFFSEEALLSAFLRCTGLICPSHGQKGIQLIIPILIPPKVNEEWKLQEARVSYIAIQVHSNLVATTFQEEDFIPGVRSEKPQTTSKSRTAAMLIKLELNCETKFIESISSHEAEKKEETKHIYYGQYRRHRVSQVRLEKQEKDSLTTITCRGISQKAFPSFSLFDKDVLTTIQTNFKRSLAHDAKCFKIQPIAEEIKNTLKKRHLSESENASSNKRSKMISSGNDESTLDEVVQGSSVSRSRRIPPRTQPLRAAKMNKVHWADENVTTQA